MEKQFVSYYHSLSLKQLGFDEPCFSYWEGESFSGHFAITQHSGKDDYIVPAPLYQQAFQFFRERFQLDVAVLKDSYLIQTAGDLPRWYYGYKDHLEAQKSCLNRLLEIVKK